MFILRSTSAHAKIDNATKVFFHDFIVQFAVRVERVVLRRLPLRFRLRQGCGATSWGNESEVSPRRVNSGQLEDAEFGSRNAIMPEVETRFCVAADQAAAAYTEVTACQGGQTSDCARYQLMVVG
jgi:hypothetical protein